MNKKPHTITTVLTRTVKIPDLIKIARFSRTPELGARILFFSGGTALAKVSSELTTYTHNAIHIITPFDSGGSSAELRRVFKMPAVGDMRSRIMTLADHSVTGNLEVIDLFAYRLPKDKDSESLQLELKEMAEGKHGLVRAIPTPLRKIICTFLVQFCEKMPDSIDLRGASIGNLILTSGYLTYDHQLDPVIYLFSKLVQAKGTVKPVVNDFAHLCVKLADNTVIVGQHHFTGKEEKYIQAPIHDIWLSHSLGSDKPVKISIQTKTRALIQSSDLICYPIGSFFSSVLANFLPKGVGLAVAQTICPKVFIPNLGEDPELFGLTLYDQINFLLRFLRADDIENIKDSDVLNFVLLDTSLEQDIDKSFFEEKKIQLLFYPLITKESFPYACAKQITSVLLSLC